MAGYFGIGLYHPKHEENVGTLFRSAYAFGANFIYTIGKHKYTRQASDTVNSKLQIPYFHYESYAEFRHNLPEPSRLVCVEISDEARDLYNFAHPKQSTYMLGNEVDGIPKRILEDRGNLVVKIPSRICLNVSATGTIVLYDRISKRNQLRQEKL